MFKYQISPGCIVTLDKPAVPNVMETLAVRPCDTLAPVPLKSQGVFESVIRFHAVALVHENAAALACLP